MKVVKIVEVPVAQVIEETGKVAQSIHPRKYAGDPCPKEELDLGDQHPCCRTWASWRKVVERDVKHIVYACGNAPGVCADWFYTFRQQKMRLDQAVVSSTDLGDMWR